MHRNTPLLVQLLLWASLGALFPTIGIGIPFGPTFYEAETFDVIGVLAAALLGLGLNEAAYIPRSCVPASSPSTRVSGRPRVRSG